MRIVCSGTIGISLSLEETFREISALGFHEIDLLLITGWIHLGLDELAADYAPAVRRVERLLGKYSLSIASVNAQYSVKLEDEGYGQTRQRQLEMDTLLRFMADFGVHHASVLPTLSDDAAYLQRTFPAFERELMRQQQYAGEAGASLSLEPHIGSAVCTNAALRGLLKSNPGLRVTYDPSHLLDSGEDLASTAYLFAHTSLVHLRDARRGELFVPYGQGNLNLPFVIDGLKHAGYDGPVVVEYLTDRHDDAAYEDLLLFAAEVQRCIDKSGGQ